MKTRPNYYGGPDSAYEAIKVIQAWQLGFELGNVVKYVARAGKKHGNPIEDLKKARQYLDFEIDKLEGKEDAPMSNYRKAQIFNDEIAKRISKMVEENHEDSGFNTDIEYSIDGGRKWTDYKGDVPSQDEDFPMYEHLYGHLVKLNDRFESVHIWSKELALKNKGRWKPLQVEDDDIVAMQYKRDSPEEIDEGLQRINKVLDDLGVSKENPYPAEQWIQNVTGGYVHDSTTGEPVLDEDVIQNSPVLQRMSKKINDVFQDGIEEYLLDELAKDLGVDDKTNKK